MMELAEDIRSPEGTPRSGGKIDTSQLSREWLQEVPKHWSVERAKWNLREINERSESGQEELLSVTEDSGVVRRSSIVDEDEHLTRAESLEGYKKCRVGDLVINIMLAWKGALGFASEPGIVSPSYSVFRVIKDNITWRFLQYLLRSDLYIADFKRRSYGVFESRLRLYADEFLNTPIVKPPLQEQKLIVGFLDKMVTKINNLIHKKERLIKLLEERRTALITRAVTKGPDPDVPMKDSRVEWLGEIPEDWETTRVGYHVDLVNGFPFSSEHFSNGEEGVPLIRIRDLGNQDTEANYTEDPETEFRVEPGDIVIGMDGDFDVDRWSGEPALLNQRLCCLQTQDSLDDRFLYYSLPAPLNVINDLTHSTTVKHLSSKQVRRITICYPPLRVQREIGRRLDRETTRLDHLIARIREAIDSLYEYRSALITAAVTGKIDVRDHAA